MVGSCWECILGSLAQLLITLGNSGSSGSSGGGGGGGSSGRGGGGTGAGTATTAGRSADDENADVAQYVLKAYQVFIYLF